MQRVIPLPLLVLVLVLVLEGMILEQDMTYGPGLVSQLNKNPVLLRNRLREG